MTWLTWTLIVLASARTWRLLAVDSITEPGRKIVDRGPAWLQQMWVCPYCLGWWIALAWTLSGWAWGGMMWWQILAGSLAVNLVAARLNVWGDE